MGQAYSRAAKKRNKGKRELFAEDVRKDERREPVERDDPLGTVMWARAQRMGVEPNSALAAPEFGDDAGRAIYDVAKDRDEAAKLWQIFKSFDRVHATFSHKINGLSRFPNVAKLEYQHERFETRDDDRPDLRGEDEKIADARNRMGQWRDAIGRLHWWHRKSILDAIWSQGEDNILSKGGKATTAGQTLVAALRCLRDEVDT